MPYDFTACKIFIDLSKRLNTKHSHSFAHSSYSLQICWLDCQRVLVDKSGVIPTRQHHHHDSPHAFTRGMNNRPVMAAVLRHQCCRCPSPLTLTFRCMFLSRRTSLTQQVSTSSPVVCDGMPSASVALLVG
jgi:hypothetical protein